jgi:predicted site-specific integrase-resolvase
VHANVSSLSDVNRTFPETAEIFGVSVFTIGRWVEAGYLSKIRIGKRRYISLDSIDDLIRHGGVR